MNNILPCTLPNITSIWLKNYFLNNAFGEQMILLLSCAS